MLSISPADVAALMRSDNPWWNGAIDENLAPFHWPKRDYFTSLCALAEKDLRRSIVLLGARRVGKTTILKQMIGHFKSKQAPFLAFLYVSIDTPTYTGLTLGQLVDLFVKEHPHDPTAPRLIIFDEIQYLKEWEYHLKDLTDRYPNTRFIVSGSAGAALKKKGRESGAGRFTDYELPPLTFAEFLRFSGIMDDKIDIPTLNNHFSDYVNFGGYPEAVLSSELKENFRQFVGRDIVDKVLLRDLPTLYGIEDTQELNKLFTMLAYNSGQEINLESLSKNSGVSKNTILKYLEYLEAAFLIHRVRRIDENASQFTRQRGFKVYLTNPSLRAALFGPLSIDDPRFGALAETAILAQWLHSPDLSSIYYARWKHGEVDFVFLNPETQKPQAVFEIKWSDRLVTASLTSELKPAIDFAVKHGLTEIRVPSRSTIRFSEVDGLKIQILPLSIYCRFAGEFIAINRNNSILQSLENISRDQMDLFSPRP